jgi:hypothetical protein
LFEGERNAVKAKSSKDWLRGAKVFLGDLVTFPHRDPEALGYMN